MEKTKLMEIEKSKILNGAKIKPISNKEKVADKIESLWNNNSSQERTQKSQSKKLTIKLETSGNERRKISLKLESSNSSIHSNNYNLISDLLKEFFSRNTN